MTSLLDKLAEPLKRLEDLASKDEKEIAFALDVIVDYFLWVKGEYIELAVKQKNILPKLVEVLQRDFGETATGSAYASALEAIEDIAQAQRGKHINAVIESGAVSATLNVLHFQNDKVVSKAAKVLTRLRDKKGTKAIFPSVDSWKSLLCAAPRDLEGCLPLINAFLDEDPPLSADDAKYCVSCLDSVDDSALNSNDDQATISEWRWCVRKMLKVVDMIDDHLNGEFDPGVREKLRELLTRFV